jgi:hypothetical protein
MSSAPPGASLREILAELASDIDDRLTAYRSALTRRDLPTAFHASADIAALAATARAMLEYLPHPAERDISGN